MIYYHAWQKIEINEAVIHTRVSAYIYSLTPPSSAPGRAGSGDQLFSLHLTQCVMGHKFLPLLHHPFLSHPSFHPY